MAGRDKSSRIKAEEKRLLGLFEGCSENEHEHIAKQVQQLAWYNVSIRDLQIAIDKTGTTVEYMNGANQYGTRKNPDIDTMVQYQKLAIAIAGNISKYISAENATAGSKLAEFLTVER